MKRPSSLDRDDLLSCGYGKMFGPGNAQLPVPNMLMMDRINLISGTGGRYGKGEIDAELGIHPDLWFFGCHFPGDTVAKREKGMLGTTLGLTAAFTACIHTDPVTLRELKA